MHHFLFFNIHNERSVKYLIMSSTIMEIDVQQCDLFSYALQHVIPLKSYECLFIFEITIKPLLHIWDPLLFEFNNTDEQILSRIINDF
jgi:hypothetical protein